MSNQTPSVATAESTSVDRVDAGRDAFVAGSIESMHTGAEYHAPVQRTDSNQSQSQTLQVQLQMPIRDSGAATAVNSRSRRGAAIALGILGLSAVVASLLALPAPMADFEFRLEVDGLSLELADTVEPIADLLLEQVAATDLGAIELPAEGSVAARRIDAGGEQLAVLVTRRSDGDPLTLNPQWLAPGSWFHLGYQGTAKSYRIGIESPAMSDGLSLGPSHRLEPVSVNFRGSVNVNTSDGVRTLHSDHGSLSLIPRTNCLDLDIAFFELPSPGLQGNIPISDLDLSRVVEFNQGNEPTFRRLSTLLAGKVRTADGVHAIEARELLTFSGLRDGFVSIRFFDDHLQIDGKGRMTGLSSTTPGGRRRSLVPSIWSAWVSPAHP